MKRQAFLIAMACIIFLSACASGPPPKKATVDEEFYAEAMDFQSKRNYFDAIPAFEALREKFPLSPYAVQAELRLGECHYLKDEFVEATHYFENFRRLHPSNRDVPYSLYMTGMCYYKQILSPDRDQSFAKEAAEHFQLLIDLYPASPFAGKALCRLTESKRQIAEHEFFVGHFYYKKQNYPGAIERFSKALREYPNSLEKDKVLYYLGESILLSGNMDRGRRILMLLLKGYPESSYAGQAKVLLAANTWDNATTEEKTSPDP